MAWHGPNGPKIAPNGPNGPNMAQMAQIWPKGPKYSPGGCPVIVIIIIIIIIMRIIIMRIITMMKRCCYGKSRLRVVGGRAKQDRWGQSVPPSASGSSSSSSLSSSPSSSSSSPSSSSSSLSWLNKYELAKSGNTDNLLFWLYRSVSQHCCLVYWQFWQI